MLHKGLLVPVLLYECDMIEKERSRIMAVQMDNLRGLVGITRMYITRVTRVGKKGGWNN